MSKPVVIICPHCQAKLKLGDRSRLGKQLKCPKCKERFLAQAPQDATPIAKPATEPAAAKTAPSKITPPNITAPETASHETTAPDAMPSFDFVAEAPPALPQRKKKKSNVGIIVATIGGILALLIAGSFIFTSKNTPTPNQKPIAKKTKKKKPPASKPFSLAKYQPTKGKPLSLKTMPAGATIFVHLKYSLLYNDDDPKMKNLNASLGAVKSILESKTKSISHFEPQQIDEILFGIIPGPAGIVPEVAAIVRLKEKVDHLALLKTLEGTPLPGTENRVYVTDTYAWIAAKNDPRTFTICPKTMAEDLYTFRDKPAFLQDSLRSLIEKSDRNRLMTIIFQKEDLQRHIPTLFSKEARIGAKAISKWLTNDVEAASWSLHSSDLFYSELKLKTKKIISGKQVQRMFQKQLQVLPEEVVVSVRKMRPTYQGASELIGRLPAMLDVVVRSSETNIEKKMVTFKTALPVKAGPNLMLASQLTWLEAGRPTQAIAVAPPVEKKPELPKTVVARLQMKIDVEFELTPLVDAFQTLANELKITLDMHGQALKIEGYTKNMPQSLIQNQIPAIDAIYHIIKQYDKMVIVIDEKKMTLIVTTKAYAKENNLKIYPVQPSSSTKPMPTTK